MNMKLIPIILAIIAVLGLIGAGLFFTQKQALETKNTSLQNELKNTQDEKRSIETELAILKATDLAKEAELLQVKLGSTEKSLAVAQGDVADLESTVQTFKTNNAKIPPYLNAIDAIEAVIGSSGEASGIEDIDMKIAALQDSQVSRQWVVAKTGIDVEAGRISGWASDVNDTIILITSQVRKLLSQ